MDFNFFLKLLSFVMFSNLFRKIFMVFICFLLSGCMSQALISVASAAGGLLIGSSLSSNGNKDPFKVEVHHRVKCGLCC